MHSFKWFQVLLSNSNNSIQHYSFICTHFSSKYCYVSLCHKIQSNQIQLNISHLFSYSWKIKLFQATQFSVSHLFALSLMSNSSIWPIDWTLSGTSTLGQSRPGSDGNEGVRHIPQSSNITGASPSDSLVSYPGHLLERVLLLCRDAVGVFYSPSWLG